MGITSVTCGALSKSLTKNLRKHEQTVAFGRGKLEIINGLVSKALVDGGISDEEFSLVLKQVSQYDDFKKEIRVTRKVQAKKGDVEEILRRLLVATAPPTPERKDR